MRHAVARVHDAARQQALRVQREHRLDGHVAVRVAVGLEHGRHELAAVRERVHGRLREHDLVVLGVDPELLVEGVVPEQLHVVPVLDDAVLDGVRAVQRHAHGRGLVAAHDLLQGHGIVDGLLRAEDGPADHRREDAAGEVLARIADLHEARAVVAHHAMAVRQRHVARVQISGWPGSSCIGQGLPPGAPATPCVARGLTGGPGDRARC
mmetsp:Transcript_13982/g.41655  ORF Transcript_13982/g.41655 Transcript_13982/m.41655 type:complete len:209 (-) Transcript_13982:18-644(-)